MVFAERGRRGGVSIGGTGGMNRELRSRSPSDIPVLNHMDKRPIPQVAKADTEEADKGDDGDKKELNLPQIVTPSSGRDHEVQAQQEPEPEPTPEGDSDREDETEVEPEDDGEEDNEEENTRRKSGSPPESESTANPDAPLSMRPEPEVSAFVRIFYSWMANNQRGIGVTEGGAKRGVKFRPHLGVYGQI